MTDNNKVNEYELEHPEEGAAYLQPPVPESLPDVEDKGIIWEVFLDTSYYDMWAVRPKGDMAFTSESLFHLPSQEEARRLAKYLSASWQKSQQVKPNGDDYFNNTELCKDCIGHGRINGLICESCNGLGRIFKQQSK